MKASYLSLETAEIQLWGVQQVSQARQLIQQIFPMFCCSCNLKKARPPVTLNCKIKKQVERMKQVSNSLKVEVKLDNEDLSLSFGAESPAFYTLFIDGLLSPLAAEKTGPEDFLGLATDPSCALACWIIRVSLPWWLELTQVNLAGIMNCAVHLRRVEVT